MKSEISTDTKYHGVVRCDVVRWPVVYDCDTRELFNNPNELTALHYVQCGPSVATYF